MNDRQKGEIETDWEKWMWSSTVTGCALKICEMVGLCSSRYWRMGKRGRCSRAAAKHRIDVVNSSAGQMILVHGPCTIDNEYDIALLGCSDDGLVCCAVAPKADVRKTGNGSPTAPNGSCSFEL